MRSFAGATLQKLWLPSPAACVLQLRVPGRTQLAVLDARLSMAALLDARPTSPLESAPRSQATLRNALEGATLTDAGLHSDGVVRLDFSNGRSLLAEAALLLIDSASRKVLWASAGAKRRPGSVVPAWTPVELGAVQPLTERAALVRDALSAEESAGFTALRKEVMARSRARVQKLRKTLAAVEEDAARASRADADRARAELLLPFASRVPRGAKSFEVPDWSRTDAEGEPALVTLALDPAVSASELAARWLKKAKRYQAALPRIRERLAEVAAQLAEAEAILQQVSAARTAAELPAVAPRPEVRRASSEERLPYRTFLSGAARILVGRSARDNDALTFRVARGNDVWLHARGMKGAHVVIPGAGDAPEATVLGDAALLAAHFSSLRGQSGVEVAWTRCKYVRKPRDAPAGSVLVTQEKTLLVRLDPSRLEALLRTEGG